MSTELLEPVDKPEDAAGDDEYCLPQNNECHLKLDFNGSTYSVSWPTEMSGEGFVESFPTPEYTRILSEDGSIFEYQYSDFESGDFELPEEPTSIHYEFDDGEVFHWTRFPSHYRVGFTAEDLGALEPNREFFQTTVSTEDFDMRVLERAYADAEKEVRNRIT